MSMYEDLKKDGIFDIEWIADYPSCEFYTLDGIRRMAEEGHQSLERKQEHLLVDGDPNAIYLWDSGNWITKVCKLTERNAELLTEKMCRTRANNLEKMLKRIKFVD